MTTVKDIYDKVSSLESELQTAQNAIQQSYSLAKASPFDVQTIAKVARLKEEQETFDRKFEDAQEVLSTLGGKTRMQTLQEFVLLFFYVGLLLVSVSILFYTYSTTNSITQTLKIGGLLLLIAFVGTGILIKYA